MWNLNTKIIYEIKKDHQNDTDKEIEKYTNNFIKKITNNLEDFSYNKIIANLYEMYSFLYRQIDKKYKKKTLVENYHKILITMKPIVPHLSSECLEILNLKNIGWPKYDETIIKENFANIVIQINGKKRGLIKVNINTKENEILEIINKDQKIFKYIQNKEMKKKIYIKNKLINIII